MSLSKLPWSYVIEELLQPLPYIDVITYPCPNPDASLATVFHQNRPRDWLGVVTYFTDRDCLDKP